MTANNGTETMRLGMATRTSFVAFTNSSYAEASDEVVSELSRLGFRQPSEVGEIGSDMLLP